jgi:hypothetical protein
MTDLHITIYTESCLASVDADDGRLLLGAALTVDLTNAVAIGAAAVLSTKPILAALLAPWRWRNLTWTARNLNGPTWFAPVNPINPAAFGARLDRVLDKLITAGHLRLQLVNDTEEAQLEEEESPRWGGLLAQYARLDPRVAVPLNLSVLAAGLPEGATQYVLLEKFMVDIDGVPRKISFDNVTVSKDSDEWTFTQSVTVEPPLNDIVKLQITRKAIISPPQAALDGFPNKGLIHGLRRTVERDGELARNWFAELPAALGRTLDPLPRLADYLDTLGQPIDLKAALSIALDRQFAPLGDDVPDRGESDLRRLMLADPDPSAPPIAMADIKTWVAKLKPELLKLRDAIIGTIDIKQADTATKQAVVVRELWRSAEHAELLSETLRATVPLVLADALTKRLDTPDNRDSLRYGLLPIGLARATNGLLSKLAARLGSADADFAKLTEKFKQVFGEELIKGLPGGVNPQGVIVTNIVTVQAQALYEALSKSEADDAAESGLTMRVDTLFSEAGYPDLHELTDGALLAVRCSRSKTLVPEWEPYQLVTRGLLAVASGNTADEDDLGEVRTPLPVAFELGAGLSASGTTEARHASLSYRGEARIPWSDRPAPVLKGDEAGQETAKAEVRLLYTGPMIGELPGLAYGRSYELTAGYQSLGGALPAGWCDPARPFVFKPDRLKAQAGYARRFEVRRTQAPGAPRLLQEKEGSEGAPEFGGALESKVRPLWQERLRAATFEGVEAQRRMLAQAATVYLGRNPGRRGDDRIAFIVRPPALAQDDPLSSGYAQRNLVRDYWQARDRDFGSTPAEAIDDPAIVGKPAATAGNGGVLVALYKIGTASPVKSRLVKIQAGEKLDISVECGDQVTLPATGDLKIVLPAGGLFALRIQTVADKNFFSGGSDPRFDDSVKDAGEVFPDTDKVFGFGSAVLALECLPTEMHLPSSDALWNAINLHDTDGGFIAWLAAAGEAFDYVSSAQTVRQLWTWDGGPVLKAAVTGLPWKSEEEDGKDGKRNPNCISFERDHFIGRGAAGLAEIAQASAGQKTTLFRIAAPANRGAGYLRTRLSVTSRYAPLRAAFDRDGTYLRATARIGTEFGEWRAQPLPLRRREPLPTPRIAVVAPLFGRLDPGKGAAGGLAIYLDHPMYDTRDGGGLAEQLVAEIIVETSSPKGKDGVASIAAGLDPVLFADGKPFSADHGMTESVRQTGDTWPDIPGKWWDPKTRTGARVVVGAIVGQTLEPDSAAPRIPFSVGFLDAIALTPDGMNQAWFEAETMARIRVRTEVLNLPEATPGSLASPWSAAYWVHFLPDHDYGNLFQVASATANGLVLKANSETDPRFLRLKELVDDEPPIATSADTQFSYLTRGLIAVIGRVVVDSAGHHAVRPIEVLKRPSIVGDSLYLEIPKGLMGDVFARLIEVQDVVASVTTGSPLAPTDRPDAWFGGGAQSADEVMQRIVGIGPVWRFEIDPTAPP